MLKDVLLTEYLKIYVYILIVLIDRVPITILQVNSVIDSSSVKSQDLEELNRMANSLDKDIDAYSTIVEDLNSQLENVTERVTLADAGLKKLKNRTDFLHDGAVNLRENANRLQEANVQGALNVTQQMADQSRQAEKMAAETNNVLLDAERYKKNTENLLAKSSANVAENRQKSKDALDRLNSKLDSLKTNIPELNHDMCGRNVSDCSDVCGGAGCGSCGGLSCDAGAMTKASQALDVAKKQASSIKDHKEQAEQLLRKVSVFYFLVFPSSLVISVLLITYIIHFISRFLLKTYKLVNVI